MLKAATSWLKKYNKARRISPLFRGSPIRISTRALFVLWKEHKKLQTWRVNNDYTHVLVVKDTTLEFYFKSMLHHVLPWEGDSVLLYWTVYTLTSQQNEEKNKIYIIASCGCICLSWWRGTFPPLTNTRHLWPLKKALKALTHTLTSCTHTHTH